MIEPKTSPIKLHPVPHSRWERAWYVLILVVLPCFCFLLSNVFLVLIPLPPSESFSDYASIMLIPQVAWFFFPLLLYSTSCLVLLLIAPKRFAVYFVIRFGIYMGVVLALQYVILETGTGWIGTIGFSAASFIILAKWIYEKVKPNEKIVGYFIIWMIPSFVTMVIFILLNTKSIPPLPSGTTFDVLFWILVLFMVFPSYVILFVSVTSTPLLWLALMVITSIKLLTTYERKPSVLHWRVAGLITWLVVYAISWHFSILQAIETYHSISTTH